MPLKNRLCIALSVAILSLTLTACKSEPVQPPNLEQKTDLDKLHQKCSAASLDINGHLEHLSEYRKQLGVTFTCDALKKACQENYIDKACVSMRTVTAVQVAHEKACRSSSPTSTACRKLGPCNLKGFTSEQCQTAIARYNR